MSTDDLGGKKAGERAAEKRVEQKREVLEWRMRQGLVKKRDIAAAHRRRFWTSAPGGKGLTPQVEGIADGSRGVICYTMGGTVCLAQPGPDAINTNVCANCNVDRAARDAWEGELSDWRQQQVWDKKWKALKQGNPATAGLR